MLGKLVFMAAFHINGRATGDTDKTEVFDFIYKQTGGQLILAIIAIELVCYFVWHCIQAFSNSENKGRKFKGIASRARYLFCGIVYGSVSVAIINMLFSNPSGPGNKEQNIVCELLSKPFGKWLVYIARGIVWLLLASLFFKSAINSNLAQTEDSSKAILFLQETGMA